MDKKLSVYFRNIVLWALAIMYYFVIHSFSTTSAEMSKAESQSVINVVEKISDAVQNKPDGDAGGKSWFSGKVFHAIVRKTAHVINFFILAFLHCMLFFSYTRKNLNTVLSTLFMGFCGAALDEMTQLFVPGRSAQVSDVFVDFTGTVIGCIFFCLLYKKCMLRFKKKVTL